MKKNKFLELDIQKFADVADNTSEEDDIDEFAIEDENIDNNTEDTGTANSKELDNEDKKASTKAYSERLNNERKKMKEEIESEFKEKLNSIAKARNFESWEELEEYDEHERLEKMGVEDPDQFKEYLNTLITNNPIVKKAQEVLSKREQEERDEFISGQIKEINKLDDTIKTIDDLAKIDRYDEFTKKIDKGYSLTDAYKLVYFDKIKTTDIEAAKQTVLNNIDSKSHLKSTTGNSGKEIYVPEDIMAMYKKNIPNMSEADIRKHYAKMVGGNE